VGSDKARAVAPNAKLPTTPKLPVVFIETDPKDWLPDEEENTELSRGDAPTGSQPRAQPTGTQPSAQPTGSQPSAQPSQNETHRIHRILGVTLKSTSRAPAIKAMNPKGSMNDAILQQRMSVLREKLTRKAADHIARGGDLADLPTCPKKARTHEKEATPEAKASSQAAAKAGANAEANAQEKAAAKAESAAAEAPRGVKVKKKRTIIDTIGDAAGQVYEDAKRKHAKMNQDAMTASQLRVFLKCRAIEDRFGVRMLDQEQTRIQDHGLFIDSMAESIQTGQGFSDHDSWKASRRGFDRERQHMRRNARLCMSESPACQQMLDAQIADRTREMAKLKDELLKVATAENLQRLPLSEFSKEAVGARGPRVISPPAYRAPGYGSHGVVCANYTRLMAMRHYIKLGVDFNGRKAPTTCHERRVAKDKNFDYVTWWLDMPGFNALSERSYGNWSGAY